MAKYTFEIPEDEISDFINDLENGLGSNRARRIAAELEEQKPSLPLPTRKQAVVRVPRGIAILADSQGGPALAWVIALDSGVYEWCKEPGKVLEIIYPG